MHVSEHSWSAHNQNQIGAHAVNYLRVNRAERLLNILDVSLHTRLMISIWLMVQRFNSELGGNKQWSLFSWLTASCHVFSTGGTRALLYKCFVWYLLHCAILSHQFDIVQSHFNSILWIVADDVILWRRLWRHVHRCETPLAY